LAEEIAVKGDLTKASILKQLRERKRALGIQQSTLEATFGCYLYTGFGKGMELPQPFGQ
jgi:hypothetical protein